MLNSPSRRLVMGLAVAALGLGRHRATAEGVRKKPHAAPSVPAVGSASPGRAGDLNSPATDFSDVSPQIDDPSAERLRPKKRRDANFD